ncbi:phosphoglycerate mutase family domain protein [Talaromyces stipitatus ATCC 10500]|uniref:Phosphoglycerate mutase family domain protein n=1 Tax=Talaromyces stipitatus (strain ATCC 10500 / CBS 375.48 / QM 6759 / NRRL 1006) TaxID=441959 RepID=B8M6Q3_TALSN|nr:phosphoglycerate mutase family domain protein [Talaromyces stipitatus ATCC 10500]EED19515.1 phosphoglycerate mutase family domain protein [Talaromyces stipitatus ATCC 10500]
MGKPRMIILIRHAQSEGNKNREIHQSVPDHRVKLTAEGHKQALEAGRRLRELLRPDDTLHFFTSPYRRTRETTEGILESLTSDDPSPSPFPRHTIKVYEEPRLREQDFGNFQPCSAEMSRMWQERADYGHFFYRIPNGESAADAYDRVSGFNESLWRLFGEDSFASVCVLVTHGLMTRVFLMKWYHFSVEYFEDLRNINHCEFVIMEKNPDNGKYVLQNKLRTWSALRQEKEEERKREEASAPKGNTPGHLPEAEVPVLRKWGGCPNGCAHGDAVSTTWRPTRRDEVDVFRDDDGGETTDANGGRKHSPSADRKKSTFKRMPSLKDRKTITHIDKSKLHLTIESHPDDIVSSPNQTPSYISLGGIVNPREPGESEALELSPAADQDTSKDKAHTPHHHLAVRDGGNSTIGVKNADISDSESDAMLPEKSESFPAIVGSNTNLKYNAHPEHSVQDAEDDGDDEGAGTSRRSRRSTKAIYQNHHHHQQHNHHYNNGTGVEKLSTYHAPPRKANALGDMADDDDDSNNMDNDNTNADIEGREAEVDKLRKEEESVSGSVY